MIARLSRNQALIAGGVAAVVVIGGVSTYALTGNDSKKVAATPSLTSAAPTATPTPSPTRVPVSKPVVAVNPLTGIGKPPSGPILAVKIDDTENGRPSVGLDKADVVYIEQAEGGLTRMVAVFGTNKPVVEAVRSVRASDAELLSQYGPISLIASGGGGDSLTTLDRSAVKGIINDRGGPGFGRDGNRPAPYNLQSNLAQVSAVAKTAGSRNVGFSWAVSDPRLTSAKSASTITTVVGGTSVTFVWDAGAKRYIRTVDGSRLHAADGAAIGSPNVIVQLCQVSVNPGDVDVVGNPSQFTHSVGSGRVVLFRNGKRIEGKWNRVSAGSPTHFTDLAGKPLLLAPGGVTVVLATVGAPV
ncbi:MAG: DUF3048 domain-containing protein [Actinomycetota bacterium]|nr:DUF3048 domain-containing protein [Actinomycetota bacterium]MDQ2958477.1 DUF3048 domain-containing protein [Actinomycetota bacterium]